MSQHPTFPWARMMHVGLGQLHLAPAEFWRSTPREISRAFGPVPPQPLLRQNLLSLMDEFPDEQQSD
jgi:uncharacterized phage protein (TIGR02216 family)